MMTGADIKSCRLCGEKSHQIILDDIVTSANDRFALNQCNNCALITTYPMPSAKLLQQYYDQDYWHSGGQNKRPALNTLYRLRMTPIVSTIRNYTKTDSRILDWGCGDGSLINLLRKFGLNCFGIDAYKQNLDDPQVSAATIEMADFPNGYFDIITCFHVLEHLADPLTSIKSALRLIKPGGVMVVEVPNLDSVGFRIFKNRWQPLEIPTHLNHFTPITLQRLFQFAGKTKILKMDFFSHRISPSALVLSMFPFLSPRRIRKKYGGRYPLSHLAVYFMMQLLAYPLAAAGSTLGHGEIIRMYVRKSG